MKKMLILLLVFMGIGLYSEGIDFESEDSKKLHNLFKEAWEYKLRKDPMFATYSGVSRYNHLFSIETIADYQQRLSMARSFLARLQKISRKKLSQEDQVNYDVFERLYQDQIAEYELQTYLLPITNRSGFHTYFPQLPNMMPFKTQKDYQNYIVRLNGFKKHTEQIIELMRLGIKKGYVLPKIVLKGYQDSIKPHIVKEAHKSLLYTPFTKVPKELVDRENLISQGKEAITKSVAPAYQMFFEFMDKEYYPACRSTIGTSALPGGRKFYEHRVRRYTTLDLTPQEVHLRGHKEVKRIRQEMKKIILKLKFKGNFADFIHFLRTDARFYVKTPEQLMKEVGYVLKKMDGQLPLLFKTLPRTPYGIKPVPDYIAPKTTTAYYMRPAGDGSRAGFYFVNTYNLKSRPLYELEALSLHEAVPGHHLQIALQQELPNIPEFRRFSGFTAFVEGWALYAERLGLEVGFYKDPYSDFGRLTYEMWRACRLVVDTGIHYLGWPRQKAIDFMAANTALTLHNVTTEIDRYISWPGQALAYKTGELAIRRLRQEAEKALGKKFDIREFHDVVLSNGSVPLKVLENIVRGYIKNKK